MQKRFNRLLLTTSLAGLGALTSEVALAQVDTITVTAERRDESAQDVPVTLQAFSEETLDKAVITKPIQLEQVTPGLQYSRQTGQVNPYIRGIGTQNTALGDESTVATYVDGVYIANMQAGEASFNNIQRVEVLKGPQGTLFGRNTTGGLIHVITKDPSQEPEFRLSADYGMYENYSVSAYLGGGISENVAADLSVYFHDQQEGFGQNLTTGNDVNFSEELIIRSKWVVDFSERAKLTLTGDYADIRTDLGSSRRPAPGAFGIDGALAFLGCAGIASFADIPTLAPATIQTCTPVAQSFATVAPTDFQDVFTNTPDNTSTAEQWGVSGKLEFDLGPVKVVSITAYRDTEITAGFSQDATQVQLIDAILPREETQFSQELQLFSQTDGPFSWIIGGFFMDMDPTYSPFELAGPGLALLAPGTTSLQLPVSQPLTSYSVFGHGSYDLTDALTFTGGLRWTKDERDLEGQLNLGFAGPPGSLSIPFMDSAEFSKLTWRFSLDYNVTDDALIYAAYSRGFKSGLFNSVVTTGVVAPPVEPEVVDSYEIGIKSNLFDNRVQFNAAGFYYDYQNIQLQQVDAGVTTLRNAATAEVFGVETEILASPTDGLDFRFGFAWLDAEYTSFPGAPLTGPLDLGFGPIGGGISGGTVDASGNRMIRAPEVTLNFGMAYERPVSTKLKIGGSFNWYYNDGFFWEPDNRLEQPSYDILNAEIFIGEADDRWRVRVYGTNLTDSEYFLYANSGQFGDNVAAAPPLVIGGGFDFRF